MLVLVLSWFDDWADAKSINLDQPGNVQQKQGRDEHGGGDGDGDDNNDDNQHNDTRHETNGQ